MNYEAHDDDVAFGTGCLFVLGTAATGLCAVLSILRGGWWWVAAVVLALATSGLVAGNERRR